MGKRKRANGTWIALAADVYDAEIEKKTWTAAVYTEDGEPLASAIDLRRDRAIRAAAAQALEKASPERVLVEPKLVRSRAIAGAFGVPIGPLGPEHDELVHRFAVDVMTRAAFGDDEADELVAADEFFSAASAVLDLLEGDDEVNVTADIWGLPGVDGEPRLVLVWAGPAPALLVGHPRDAEALYAAAGSGEPPACPARGLLYLLPSEVSNGMVEALQRMGWDQERLPCMAVTEEGGREVGGSAETMKELTLVLDALVEAGLERAVRGALGLGHVDVPLDDNVRVLWNLGAPRERILH